jgi:hypothetical protein
MFEHLLLAMSVVTLVMLVQLATILLTAAPTTTLLSCREEVLVTVAAA